MPAPIVVVDVVVSDSTVSALPIAGVTVTFYDQSGTTLTAQAVTDVTGTASVMLPSSTIYSLRFYKLQVNFKSPLLIDVEGSGVNIFDVKGEVLTPPVSSDARLCVVYGTFRTGTGVPAAYTDMHFIPTFSPVLLDGAAVLTERTPVRSDANGYVEVPLIRNGIYDVLVQGMEDLTRPIAVPDLINASLPDLLFPVVSNIAFSPLGPYSIATGGTLTLTPTVTASDFEVLTGSATEDVFWDTDNHLVAVVGVTATTLVILGVSAGTCNIIARRVDQTIIRIPDPGITGVPQLVTVTL